MEKPHESVPHKGNSSALRCAAEECNTRAKLLELFCVLHDSTPCAWTNRRPVFVQAIHKNGSECSIDLDHAVMTDLKLQHVIWAEEPCGNMRHL